MQRTLQGAGEHPGQWPQVDEGQPGSGNPEYLGTGSQSGSPGLRLASRSNSWGVRALPLLTEHLLFDGSCWVPRTKEAPVPRGACSVPLTLNVRKRSSLNLTTRGPCTGLTPLCTPPTHWAPAPGPLHVLLRVRAQMFFLHTNVIREFFPFGFYFKCNST